MATILRLCWFCVVVAIACVFGRPANNVWVKGIPNETQAGILHVTGESRDETKLAITAHDENKVGQRLEEHGANGEKGTEFRGGETFDGISEEKINTAIDAEPSESTLKIKDGEQTSPDGDPSQQQTIIQNDGIISHSDVDSLQYVEGSESKVNSGENEYFESEKMQEFDDDKLNGHDIDEDFHSVSMPTDFDSYDVYPKDGFVTLAELVNVTGAAENVGMAFEDSDKDGDKKLTRKEFYDAPWMLQGDPNNSISEEEVEQLDGSDVIVQDGDASMHRDDTTNSVEDANIEGAGENYTE